MFEFQTALFESYRAAKRSGHDCRPMLNQAIQAAKTEDEKHYAWSLLAVECRHFGDTVNEERAWRACIDLDPSIAASWIALARFQATIINDETGAVESLNQITSGLCVLRGDFRYAHTERIRIAIELKRVDLVEESLALLRDHVPVEDELDTVDEPLVEGLRSLGIDEQLIAILKK